MTYEIRGYNSQQDFDNCNFVMLDSGFTDMSTAIVMGRQYLQTFPIVKVQSDDCEEIKILKAIYRLERYQQQ